VRRRIAANSFSTLDFGRSTACIFTCHRPFVTAAALWKYQQFIPDPFYAYRKPKSCQEWMKEESWDLAIEALNSNETLPFTEFKA
jgi:hypothetical protein